MLRRTEKIVLREDGEEAESDSFAHVRRGLSALRPQRSSDVLAEPDAAPQPIADLENVRRMEEPPVELSPEQKRNIERWRAEVLQSVSASADDGEPGRLGRFLKPANIALLAVALLAGGAAAFLATQPQGGAVTAQIVPAPAPTPETVVVTEPMAKVLVAKADIGIGERLSDRSVEWIDWPKDSLRPDFMTTEAADADTGVADAVARFEFVAGEPILETKLTRAAEGFLSAVLDPGTRAVAVSVSAESGSGGFILPNDRVDIVHTVTINERQVSTTILSNIRVIAINSALGKAERDAEGGEGEEKPKSRTFSSALATLSLDPRQAELVISATGSGQLSLVLRPTADVAEAQTADHSQAANEAIRLSSPFWAN